MEISFDKIEELLIKNVRRPSRYIGAEVGAVKKDWDACALKACLVFPDVYEVGMSHIGLSIIYNEINAREGFFADRAFTPWGDADEGMRALDLPLWGLVSRRELKDFDIIGFTLPFELTYTNILTVLSLSKIPFFAGERDSSHPLIIGGGVGAFNPEPVAPFFDVILLGDGELATTKICEEIASFPPSRQKTGGQARGEGEKRALLERLAKIKGVYVPSIPGQKVFRATINDINSEVFPPIVSYTQLVHDRIGVEIQRGCARGCRFCQAGYLYRPVRQKKEERVVKEAVEGVCRSGNEELSFLSLSAGDYLPLVPMAIKTANALGDNWTNMSLPSLRVETLTDEVIDVFKRTLGGGFTLAPEAATERLRRVINKGNSEEDLLKTIESVFSAGWRLLKLYFMIGLPTETEEDLRAIVDLSKKAYSIGRRYRHDITITVSVSTFVPKAHTPFQWERQLTIEETLAKQNFLKQNLRQRGIELKWHNAEMSGLEGVFARGGRELAGSIVSAWQNGARFDSWDDIFSYARWQKAFADNGIDVEKYRELDVKKELPWDHLFTELDKNFLLSEREKAFRGELTADCTAGECAECGVCEGPLQNKVLPAPVRPEPVEGSTGVEKRGAEHKYEFTVEKGGELKWLSQLEMMQALRRALRRAGFKTTYSQGFHPHMKLSLSPALKVGGSGTMTSTVFLFDDIPLTEFVSRLSKELPDGLKIS